jgi:formylglycine-generating enzyme required for sulfatase activity
LVSNELYYRFVSESPYWRTAEYDADSSYLKHWRNDGPQNAERWSPVTNISFRAAKAFAGWLSKLTSRHMRLPKLEEWQLAARAGRDHWFEDEVAAGRVNYFDTSRRMSTVESFGSNPYGIRDLIGQAFDMCSLDDALLRPAIVGGCSHNTLKQLRDALQGEEINSDKTCLPDVSFRCVRSA